jgi:hypothetical protein
LAAAAGSFLRYLDRRPKELFFSDKPRSETIFKLKTLPKKFKNRNVLFSDQTAKKQM